MNTPPDDIDDWLERREPLFPRSPSAERLEPPSDIDRVVLAKARAALRNGRGSEDQRPAFFTLSQWSLPLGLAATLLLAIAVVVRVNPGAPVAASDIAENTDKLDLPPPAASVAAPDVAAQGLPEEASREAVAPARGRAAGPESTPQEQTRELRRSSPAMAASKAAPNDEVAVLPEAAPAVPPGLAATPMVAASSTPATEAAAAGAVAAAPAPVPSASASVARVTDAVASSESANASAAVQAEALRLDPLRWYRHVVALREQGRATDAEREWRALKKRFPDFEPPTAPVGP